MLSRDSSLETAKNTADNLYQLMELINSNIIDMDIEQIISLSGLCLDLSAQVSMWMDSEFERREKQRNLNLPTPNFKGSVITPPA